MSRPGRLGRVRLGLRRHGLDDDVALADQDVRVGADLDVAEQHAAGGRCGIGVTVPGTVQLAPAGRSALASVTLTDPKAAFVKTST